MAEPTHLFSDDYPLSRERFRGRLAEIRPRWPQSRLHSHSVGGDPSLTIDWIEAPAVRTRDHLFMLTTGEHGVEGYVGSAMLQLFLDEFVGRLDPHHTGLLLVHAINPWGMHNRRRTNAANVDLNRSFVSQPSALDSGINPGYDRFDSILNPQRPLRSLASSQLSLLLGMGLNLLRMGSAALRAVILQGQYRYPRGLYYGGQAIQEETRQLIDLYRQTSAPYDHVVHIDMHTGYGPRDQMTVVNSSQETRSSRDLERLFGYPRVVKATLDEFYPMRGDMVDFLYALFREECRNKRLYATAFEFGTLGDTLAGQIRDLRTMIWENQVYHYGTPRPGIRQRVQRDFLALYAPHEAAWRAKAVFDARQAFEGMLRVEGLVPA
jgi:predicted deacylase